MPLGDIAASALGFLIQAIVEVLFYAVFYWIGKVVLLVLTLGRYPQPDSNEEFVAVCGILITGLTIWAIVAFL